MSELHTRKVELDRATKKYLEALQRYGEAREACIAELENRLARVLSVLDPGEEPSGDWDHEFQSSEKWQIWNRQRKLYARVKAIAEAANA